MCEVLLAFVFTSKISQFLWPKRQNCRRNPALDEDQVRGYLDKGNP